MTIKTTEIETEIENLKTRKAGILSALAEIKAQGKKGTTRELLQRLARKLHLQNELNKTLKSLEVFQEGLGERVNMRVCEIMGERERKEKRYPKTKIV